MDTTFQQANVGSIKAALERQLLLRKPALHTHLAKRLSEGPLRAGSRMNVAAALLCQQPYAAMLTTIVQRIIVRILRLVGGRMFSVHVVGRRSDGPLTKLFLFSGLHLMAAWEQREHSPRCRSRVSVEEAPRQ